MWSSPSITQYHVILRSTVCAVNIIRAAQDSVGNALRLLMAADMRRTGSGHSQHDIFTQLSLKQTWDHKYSQKHISSAIALLAHTTFTKQVPPFIRRNHLDANAVAFSAGHKAIASSAYPALSSSAPPGDRRPFSTVLH